MKTLRHCAVLLFLVAMCSALTFADEPGYHPGYLHALSDLRAARAHIDRPTASYQLNGEEQHALDKINSAIDEAKRAAVNVGKDLQDHPAVDPNLDRRGRYRRALELLDKAHEELAAREDDPSARGWRDRCLHHVDEAHRIIEHMAMQISGN